MREEFRANMLRIYFNGDDTYQGISLQEALLEAARSEQMMLAIVYRALEGFGASTTIHRQTALSGGKTAPVMMTILDRPERIEKFMPVLDGRVEEGLIATSPVEVIRLSKEPA
jgi:uncharacterized protein